jgi:hypothetical protein
MVRFNVGGSYSMKSICDHRCVWTVKITGRSDKTVRFEMEQKTKEHK